MKNLITPKKQRIAYGMKTFAVLLTLWISFGATKPNELRAQSCCPEFTLKDAVEICPPQGACGSDGAIGGHAAAACKLSYHEYTVYPNDQPMYTYTWTVTGGTPASFSGNPINVLWGSGSTGYIKVVISNLAAGGSCIDSITEKVCLIDGPKANFTFNPNPVCANMPVTFTNTSSGGFVYLWDNHL